MRVKIKGEITAERLAEALQVAALLYSLSATPATEQTALIFPQGS